MRLMRRVQLWCVVQVAGAWSLCCYSWWTFWALVKYWMSSWQSSLKCLNFWRQAVLSLSRYSLLFNAQLHVHLKSEPWKFKLLYPWNCIGCFSEICTICCVNTHIWNPKVWLKSLLPLLKYRNLSRGLFYWCTLYIGSCWEYIDLPRLLSWATTMLHVNYCVGQLSLAILLCVMTVTAPTAG